MDADYQQKYKISDELGFLRPDPLTKLPSKFQPWHDLADKLPSLLAQKKLREEVKKLPDIDASSLQTTEELRCAHVVLAFLCNSYMHQDGAEGIPKTLPRQLAVPLAHVSDTLGYPSGLCYASTCLSNWKRKDPNGPVTYENMDTLVKLEDAVQFDAMFKGIWYTELAFAPALKWIVKGLKASQDKDAATLTTCLQEMAKVLPGMKEAFATMNKEMLPEPFYDKVFAYLPGWGYPDGPLPEGLVFEGVSGTPRKLRAANAAESSTFQTLDAFLGLPHDAKLTDNMRYIREFYNPREHFDFIEHVKSTTKVLEMVESSNDANLKAAYKSVVDVVRDFRSYHIQMIVRFMVSVESRRKQEAAEKGVTLAPGPGQATLPYLKSLRDTSTSK